MKLYIVTPHLNRLIETFQMRGHNICYYAELTKIITNYHQISPRYSLLTTALAYVPHFSNRQELRGMLQLVCMQKFTPLTTPGPKVIKLFFMLNSTEHEIFPAHKC